MNDENKIYNKYGKDSGMKIPEGYFNSLQERIMESLPPYQEAQQPKELTGWQRIKPYVYLAAMFCGIWLMMKVFHHVSQPMNTTSLDNPPAVLAELLDDYPDENWQISYDYESDYEIEEEVVEIYDNIEDFEKDFGYNLSPEYSGPLFHISLENQV